LIKRYLTFIVTAATLAGCGSTQVFQADQGFDKRVYVGGGILVSQVEPDTSEVPSLSVDTSASSGAGLLLGYDLNNRFSVEGHLADLGEATLAPSGTVGYQVAGLSGLFYFLNDHEARMQRRGFSAFGRLGLGTLNNDTDGVEFRRINVVHLLAGAGVEYGFSRGLALRAELVAHETDAKYIQAGLLYRFGGRGNQEAPKAIMPVEQIDVPEPEVAKEAVVEPVPTVVAPVPAPIPAPKPAPKIVQTDTDGDGVFDRQDRCPGTDIELPVRADGCEIFNGPVRGIGFVVGSADLTTSATVILRRVAEILNEYPDVNVTIEAHTDNMGDAADNLQLSRRRALAVTRFLVGEGVSGARIRPQAFGESRPMTSNETAAGRAENRRVELKVRKK